MQGLPLGFLRLRSCIIDGEVAASALSASPLATEVDSALRTQMAPVLGMQAVMR
jgi:hypothetical protein